MAAATRRGSRRTVQADMLGSMENKAVGKSELHRIDLRHIRSFTGSEESDDNREAHGNLGGCYGNDEEKENVAFVGGVGRPAR